MNEVTPPPFPEKLALSEDYLQRFGGVSRLVSRPGLEKLAAAHVCVVGVGGVGSWTVEGLARSGIGRITMVDLDEVCVTNVNRQLPALSAEIGNAKVRVVEKRIHEINPECVVNAQEIFEVARQSEEPEDMTIYLNSTSFRIQRGQGRVTVEGQSGLHRCLLQTAKVQHFLIPDQPRYIV